MHLRLPRFEVSVRCLASCSPSVAVLGREISRTPIVGADCTLGSNLQAGLSILAADGSYFTHRVICAGRTSPGSGSWGSHRDEAGPVPVSSRNYLFHHSGYCDSKNRRAVGCTDSRSLLRALPQMAVASGCGTGCTVSCACSGALTRGEAAPLIAVFDE